ncbi:indole-2-monooxygenase [Dichanthelium oligosanthes]|uniref:Indole-2-monooxygenase n=1 Tax=Dichanthelium oligosanthes TaxID=888268 RepID=A0A1E5UJU0_9POAL|nr:indole-2-monooxygenase [Dichanthelium oligosanthes]
MAHVHVGELLLEAAAAPRTLFLIAMSFAIVLLPLLFRMINGSAKGAAASDAKLLSLLPSPPSKLPVIGHLHLMGDLPYVSMAGLATKYGPNLMLVRLGAVPTVVVSSPSTAEAVLRTHDHVFASRPRSMVSDVIMYGATDSCFAPYGEHFRKARKLVTVHLLNAMKVRSQRSAREEEIRHVMGMIGKAAAAREAVDMSDLLHSYVNDLVCRAVSGKFSQEEGRNKLFRELTDINAGLLGGFNIGDFFPSLGKIEWFKKLASAKARRVRKRWDHLLDKLIDDHATRMASREDGAETEQEDKDFIYVLLSLQQEYGLTRDHMKAILIDMFEAGTDTSYMTLEFAMAELIRKPQLMKKLQDEVRKNVPAGQEMVTEDNLANMTYLKAVIKETLRLHPPVPLMIPHFSLDACDIDGYTIPANTRVVVNAWALGRHSGYWENVNEFQPERFMKGDGANTVDLKANEFHFLAFGSGRRMCPGVHSASATIETMLSNLMYRFDWKLQAGLKGEDVDMTEVFGITVSRKEKLLLVPETV